MEVVVVVVVMVVVVDPPNKHLLNIIVLKNIMPSVPGNKP